MNEEIESILFDFQLGEISRETATNKILEIFVKNQFPNEVKVGKMVSDLSKINDNSYDR